MEETPSQAQPVESRLILDPVGHLFSDSWRLYKERFSVLVGIMILPVIVIFLAYLMMSNGSSRVVGYITLALGLFIFLSAFNASIIAITQGTKFSESYRGGLGIFWPMLGTGFLVTFAVYGGFFMFAIPGILMGIWFLFSSFIVAVERKKGINALTQGREYVRGYWWAVFGRYLLLPLAALPFIIIYMLSLVLLGQIIGIAVYCIIILLILPFALIYLYGLYKNFTIIKPTLASTQSTSGRGFFIASVIVGIVGIIALIVFSIFIGRYLRSSLSSAINLNASVGQGGAVALGASSTPLGELSVILPAGFQIDTLSPSQVIIQQTTSTEVLETSFVTIAVGKLDPATYITEAEAQLSSSGQQYTQTTSTFLGYPATEISYSAQGAQGTVMVFQSNGSMFAVISNELDSSSINATLDQIVASMTIATPDQNETSSSSSLEITSPVGGAVLRPGSTYDITWRSSGFEYVYISLSLASGSGSPVGISEGPAANGNYSWTVPTSTLQGGVLVPIFPPGQYKLELSGNDNDFVNHHFASDTISVKMTGTADTSAN